MDESNPTAAAGARTAGTAVVDVHNHAVPASFLEAVRRDGGRYGYELIEAAETERGDLEVATPDGIVVSAGGRKSDEAARAADMATAGIDLRLQSISPGLMGYGAGEAAAEWAARELNDALAADQATNPAGISAMATVPLQFPGLAVRELERATREHGMRTVQIATNVNGENLDHPQFIPFWEAAAGLDLLVFVHPRYQLGRHRMSRYRLSNLIGNPLETTIAAGCLVFGGVLERSPTLKVCLAHGGGYVPYNLGRWRHAAGRRSETRAEADAAGGRRPLAEYVRRLYFDSLVFDDATIRFLVETVGADRVILGTDYPTTMSDPQQVHRLAVADWLDAEQRAMILGGNALGLLGLARTGAVA